MFMIVRNKKELRKDIAKKNKLDNYFLKSTTYIYLATTNLKCYIKFTDLLIDITCIMFTYKNMQWTDQCKKV